MESVRANEDWAPIHHPSQAQGTPHHQSPAPLTHIVVGETHGHEVLGRAEVIHLVTPDMDEQFSKDTQRWQPNQPRGCCPQLQLQLRSQGLSAVPKEPPNPPNLLKEHEGEGLHQAVEGLLRDALGVAALKAQSPGFSSATSSHPTSPHCKEGGETAVCLSQLFFLRNRTFLSVDRI